jgi:cytochrome P450
MIRMKEIQEQPAIQYDLFSPTFKADPFPTFARMRQETPIHAHQAPDGSTIWYITRYEDVSAVLRDDENFCKDPRNARDSTAPGAASRRSAAHKRINENMLFSDPPDHTRLRSLVSQAFTPHRIDKLAPRVQTIANDLLDQVQGMGKMDLIAAYALPLPVFVICEMLGIPESDREQVADWSQAIISPGSRNLSYSARKRKVRAFTTYLDNMFAERQTNPRDDLVTALVQAEEEGDRFNEAELSSMVVLLLVTGHETTVNLIGNGTLALLLHPDQLVRLQDFPSFWTAAVEELLRYDGPVETSTSRWARNDVWLGDHLIKRGDLVRVVLTSANRDEEQFSHPDTVDIQRDNNKHLAFGLGIHYCLGAPLARLEGRIALQTLFRRLPDLRLSLPMSQLEWRSGVLFRGLKKLDLAWDNR